MEKFSPIKLEQKDEYYALWEATPQRSLDYTLANLWGWQEYYGLQWRFEDGLCWIARTIPEIRLWAPLGPWQEIDWPRAFARLGMGKDLRFNRVPQKLRGIWLEAMPGMVEESEDRGQWEYLYKQEELATLPGNRFHKKRNHLNGYIKSYGEPDYHPIDTAMIKDVLAVQNVWCHWHECDDSTSLRAENDAINRVLDHWGEFKNLVAGSLYVDGAMIAFSVGEKLDPENLGVHYEKGLNGYKGVYQAMNYEFARHAGQGFKWINRAQDLDEEGLRQAKMTYIPADFLRKYKIDIKI